MPDQHETVTRLLDAMSLSDWKLCPSYHSEILRKALGLVVIEKENQGLRAVIELPIKDIENLSDDEMMARIQAAIDKASAS